MTIQENIKQVNKALLAIIAMDDSSTLQEQYDAFEALSALREKLKTKQEEMK